MVQGGRGAWLEMGPMLDFLSHTESGIKKERYILYKCTHMVSTPANEPYLHALLTPWYIEELTQCPPAL